MAGMNGIAAQLSAQIEKAQKKNEPDEIVAVMKEVRKLLKQMQEDEHEN